MKRGLFPGLLLFCLLTSAAHSANLLTVNPTTLEFNRVSQGTAKTLKVRLKTSAALGVAIQFSVASPFELDRKSFSMDKLTFNELAVTLPSTVPLGDYSGTLSLSITPIGIETSSSEKIDVPVHALVGPALPDFSADARIESCKTQGKFINCSIDLFVTTTAPATISVHAVITQSTNEKKDETTALDRVVEAAPKSATPIVFEIAKLPSKTTKQIILRISLDPENKIQEENEGDNTKEVALDIPGLSAH